MAGTGTAHLRPVEDVLLRVEDLVVDFPTSGGRRVRRGGRQLRHRRGRDARHRGRERLRQVDRGAGHPAAPGAHRRHHPVRGPRSDGRARARRCASCARGCRSCSRTRSAPSIPVAASATSSAPRSRSGSGAPRPSGAPRSTRRSKPSVSIRPWPATSARTSSPAASASASASPVRSSSNRELIICDEPVSALDVSVQAQILNLLEDLKVRYGLTLAFITHDLAVVKNVSDRVAVMYLGKICELADPDQMYAAPAHPYTAALLSAIPVPDPQVTASASGLVPGDLPSPISPPSGCRFRTRCPRAEERCAARGAPRPPGRGRPVRGVPLPAGGRRRPAGGCAGRRGRLRVGRWSPRPPHRPGCAAPASIPRSAAPRSSKPPASCSGCATRRPCASTRSRMRRGCRALSSTPTSPTGAS